jgi:hypothetical protein
MFAFLVLSLCIILQGSDACELLFSQVGLWDGAKRTLTVQDFKQTIENLTVVMEMTASADFNIPSRSGTGEWHMLFLLLSACYLLTSLLYDCCTAALHAAAVGAAGKKADLKQTVASIPSPDRMTEIWIEGAIAAQCKMRDLGMRCPLTTIPARAGNLPVYEPTVNDIKKMASPSTTAAVVSAPEVHTDAALSVPMMPADDVIDLISTLDATGMWCYDGDFTVM